MSLLSGVLIAVGYDPFVTSDGHIVFRLCETRSLNEYADKVRATNGEHPFFYGQSNSIDHDGWYAFYVTVRPTEGAGDLVALEYFVENHSTECDESLHKIPLTESESRDIYASISNQCELFFEKTFDQMLSEE